MNTIITEENARKYATIFEMVEAIRELRAPEDFYGVVEPTQGMQEVYARLTGWRKEAYRRFLMAGYYAANDFGSVVDPTSFGWGNMDKPHPLAEVCVRVYKPDATDWQDYREETRLLTWGQLCNLYD